jgi:hypothetical protein
MLQIPQSWYTPSCWPPTLTDGVGCWPSTYRKADPRGRWKRAYFQNQKFWSQCKYRPRFCTPHVKKLYTYHDLPLQHLAPQNAPAARFAFYHWILPLSGRRLCVLSKGFIHGRLELHQDRDQPIFTARVYDQMEVLMRFDVTTSKDSFPLICGTVISGDCLTGRQILLARINDSKCLNILRTHLELTTIWRVLQECIFTWGFNTTVLHHIRDVQCVSWCPKIILDAGLVVTVTLEFPGLHDHLTSTFSVGIFETRGLCQHSLYKTGTLASNSTLRKWNKEYTPGIFKDLRVAFTRTIELCAREHGGNFAPLLWENKNKVINSSFVCILKHSPINLGSSQYSHGIWKRIIFDVLRKALNICIYSDAQTPLIHSWSWALLETLPIVQQLKNFPAFRGTRRSLPCSQEPSTGPYPEPDQSNPYHPILFL